MGFVYHYVYYFGLQDCMHCFRLFYFLDHALFAALPGRLLEQAIIELRK
jgi:hypothetical protein